MTIKKGGNPNPQQKGLKPWKPGQSGNPGGKPKLPEALKQYKKYATVEGQKQLFGYAGKSVQQIKADEKDQSLEGIKALAAKLWYLALVKNNMVAISILMDRIHGKVSDKLQIKPEPTIIKRLRENEDIILGSTEIDVTESEEDGR